jgi:hypothetical protein
MLAREHARLDERLAAIKKKALRFVADKAAAAKAAAQSAVDGIVIQSHHDIMILKQETNEYIATMRDLESALRKEIEEKDEVITAQDERLAQALERLAIYEMAMDPNADANSRP